jgi:hypothetical protein
VPGGYLDLARGDPEQRFAVDDEARHAADATPPVVARGGSIEG